MSTVNLDERTVSTVLAALRFWQFRLTGESPGDDYADIASNNGAHVPLTEDEIDGLCDVLNAGYGDAKQSGGRDSGPFAHGLHVELDPATGEPANVEQYGYALQSSGTRICDGLEADHARRIVACVNACAGIPTETLDGAAFVLADDETPVYELVRTP